MLSNLNSEQLESLLDDASDNPKRLNLFLRGGQRSFIEPDEFRFKTVVDYLLDKNPETGFRRSHSVIDAFVQVLSPHRYTLAFKNRHPMPLHAQWDRVYGFADASGSMPSVEDLPPFVLAEKCQEVVEVGRRLSEYSAADWATALGPWNELVERARQLFGDRWVFRVLANSSAGIRTKDETCDDASELHDPHVPLCRRVRYARLRAGASSWWESQLKPITEQEDLAFTLLVLLTWGGPTVLEKHAELLDSKLRSLQSKWWRKLSNAIQFRTYGFGQEKRDIKIDLEAIPGSLSERTIVALSSRVSERDSDYLFQRHFKNYDGDDPAVLEFCQRSALRAAQQNPDAWQNWLSIISRSYAKGVISDRYFGYAFARAVRMQDLPQEIAEEIVQDCESYPTELVGWAEQVCRQRVAEQVVPVGTVAENQNWFRL